MPTEPQYWIKFLDPWMHDFYPVLGFGPRTGRTQLFLTPALDKNRFPKEGLLLRRDYHKSFAEPNFSTKEREAFG